jgi:glyoxylase-like metal-dependent hydrolase (beta-lactamase superfamily II)
VSAGLVVGAAWMAPRGLTAQTGGIVQALRNDAAKATIAVQPLRGGISALIGSGGNIAVLPGPDGKVLIDPGISDSRQGIAEALARLSADPIAHLVNTHWHFGHTDGNA